MVLKFKVISFFPTLSYSRAIFHLQYEMLLLQIHTFTLPCARKEHRGGSKVSHTAPAASSIVHTLALLRGERQALGSVWRVAAAADAGAGAAVRRAGHVPAHGRTLSDGRERGSLSPVVVSVLPERNGCSDES